MYIKVKRLFEGYVFYKQLMRYRHLGIVNEDDIVCIKRCYSVGDNDLHKQLISMCNEFLSCGSYHIIGYDNIKVCFFKMLNYIVSYYESGSAVLRGYIPDLLLSAERYVKIAQENLDCYTGYLAG